jgi:hypothetical protein
MYDCASGPRILKVEGFQSSGNRKICKAKQSRISCLLYYPKYPWKASIISQILKSTSRLVKIIRVRAEFLIYIQHKMSISGICYRALKVVTPDMYEDQCHKFKWQWQCEPALWTIHDFFVTFWIKSISGHACSIMPIKRSWRKPRL